MSAARIRLSESQARMLNRLQDFRRDPKDAFLFFGRDCQTARALERRGLVTVRLHAAPSAAWVTITYLGLLTPTNH